MNRTYREFQIVFLPFVSSMGDRFIEWIFRLIFRDSSMNYKFPKTLAEFGYAFNADGELRKIDPATGQPGNEKFEFNVKEDDRRYNQKHYEALGDVITEHVYSLLDDMGLKRLPVPFDAKLQEPQTFVFVSHRALEQNKPLLVLVHGSGAVQAGQWARSLIINDKLDTGTQIPYIKRALELDYGVLILNTNDNFREVKRRETSIRGSGNPEEQMFHVWDNYIVPSRPKKIAFVAHSYGGLITSYLCWERLEEYRKRVFAVAMTDSIHYGCETISDTEDDAKQHLCTIGRNWKASDEPLDTPVQNQYPNDISSVSAGHSKHEMTSASAMESVFAFIEERRQGIVKPLPSPRPVSTRPVESVPVAELLVIDEKNDAPSPATDPEVADEKKPKTDSGGDPEAVTLQHQEL
ncbi:hypothetical protein B566_EDAN000872 [Ephemera danica]|nr:hypothetical protein B566_EDAN000872 [Ephemera danica]